MKQCKECGKDFEPKHTKGVFCSPVCKQRNYRKSVAAKLKLLKKLTKDKPVKRTTVEEFIMDNKDFISKIVNVPLSGDEPETDNVEIENQIAAIKAEKIPPERNTTNGRKVWAIDQAKRIKELESKLK